jgi:hypothetical protein
MKTPLLPLSTLAVTGLTMALLFIGCKKEADEATAEDKQVFASSSSIADAEAEDVLDDIFYKVATGEDSTSCYLANAVQLNGSTRFPLTVTIDFGSGCTGADGRVRKGKITVVYTGRLSVAGSSATTTFEGYYLDSVQVDGTYKITNTSSQGGKSYTLSVTSATLTKPSGNYTSWNSEKTITQSAGLATPLISLDDVFSITGEANGIVKKANKLFAWNTSITTPLVKKYTCRRIVSGTVSIQKNNAAVAVLDYGTGQCDRKATLMVNGDVLEISLD